MPKMRRFGGAAGGENTSNALRRLQQGARSSTGDKMAWAFYDTLVLDPNIADYDFFIAGIGGSYNGVNKTRSQTNLPSSGMTPQGHRHNVYDIKFEYFTREDKPAAIWIQKLYTWIWNAWIECSIAGKDAIWQIALSELVGQSYFNAIVPAATYNTVFSQGNFNGVFKLNIPIVLPALQTFRFSIHSGVKPYPSSSDPVIAGQTGDQIRLNLDGYLERVS